MNRKRIAERLVFLAKELVNAGEVPEAFKEQWDKNKKDDGDKKAGEVPEAFKKQWDKNKKDDGEKKDDSKKPDFLKDKKAVAGTLLKIARELMAAAEDSPYKTKVDLDTARRDMEHRSIRALDAVMSLNPKAKLVRESLLTYSEGTSHKFHFFALYDDNGVWKAGNAYGRIGGEPKSIMISSGSRAEAEHAYDSKLRAKLAKGYEEA